MQKTLLAACLLVCSVTATAKSPCDPFVPYGYPTVAFKSQVLCRTSYLQIHNNTAKTGGIAYEYLTPTTVGTGNEPRTNNFRADIEVPREFRATPKEYEGTGFDKGHIAAAGDMQEDGKSMSQSFFMSNMAPQYPKHNRGIWRGLEVLTRNYVVKQNRNLFIITGTAYLRDPSCLPKGEACGDSGVWIPDAFYKVIIDKDAKDAVAFIIPNIEGGFKKLIDYRVGICDLEKILSGGQPVNLFPTATPAEKTALCTAPGSSFPARIK
jgi:endonuclease G, mitochondrial